MMQDRRAVFTPSFKEFLEGQKRVVRQDRLQQRFRQEDNTFKYVNSEWQDVVEPSYKEEVLPQTLSEDDIRHDRWPAAIYRFTLENGMVLESFVQDTREFSSLAMVVDFMGLRLTRDGKEIEELCWGQADIAQYLPQITNASSRRTRIAALEVNEPQPV